MTTSYVKVHQAISSKSAATLTSENPTLDLGELRQETDTGRVKIGDGSTTWTSLRYFGIAEAFPVGAVFIGVVDTNPATLLGYGTWAAFGTGRVLVGLDSGDTDFDAVEETGGSKTHTHSVTSNVAVADHSFTQPTISWPISVPVFAGTNFTTSNATTGLGVAAVTSTKPSGTNSWPASVPTNASGAVSAHSVTNNAVTSGFGSNVPPYITVYMWKRTA